MRVKPLADRKSNLRSNRCEFGEWLDGITLSRNISRTQACEMLGIGTNTIKEWVRGNSKIHKYTIAGIARIFHLDLTDEDLEYLYKRFNA